MSAVVNAGTLPFVHLSHLTDSRGLLEHALLDQPRLDHGYCVDDAARGLLVTARDAQPTAANAGLLETYLGFIEAAIEPDGRIHNRMDTQGQWAQDAWCGDWWGRALWATGVAAARATQPGVRRRSLHLFGRLAEHRSSDLRPMVFAGLGAVDVITAHPRYTLATRILTDAVAVAGVEHSAAWPWPEPRLRYSNGSIPELLIAAGAVRDDPVVLAHGLRLLEMLLDIETQGSHLSVTGTQGRSPHQRWPQFDQQPIEVAAIADACARAYDVTGDRHWLTGVRQAWEWFMGTNDAGMAMVDTRTGAGYDGLMLSGRNHNRGAESTLAALSTFQQAHRLLGVEVHW